MQKKVGDSQGRKSLRKKYRKTARKYAASIQLLYKDTPSCLQNHFTTLCFSSLTRGLLSLFIFLLWQREKKSTRSAWHPLVSFVSYHFIIFTKKLKNTISEQQKARKEFACIGKIVISACCLLSFSAGSKDHLPPS